MRRSIGRRNLLAVESRVNDVSVTEEEAGVSKFVDLPKGQFAVAAVPDVVRDCMSEFINGHFVRAIEIGVPDNTSLDYGVQGSSLPDVWKN